MIKIKTIDPNKINQNYKIKDINIELPNRGFVVFCSEDKGLYLDFIKTLGLIYSNSNLVVDIDGVDCNKLKGDKRSDYINKFIGYISETNLLSPDMSVKDYLSMVSYNPSNIYFEKFNFKDLENKKIYELSIEEKEKVLLLIAMLKDSSIILLEPALSLNEKEIDFFKEESKNRLIIGYAESIDSVKDNNLDYVVLNNGIVEEINLNNKTFSEDRSEDKDNKELSLKLKFGNKIKFALSFIKHNILQVIISFILLFAGLTMYGISDAYYSFDLSGQVTQRIEDCSDNYISISTYDFKDIKVSKEDFEKSTGFKLYERHDSPIDFKDCIKGSQLDSFDFEIYGTIALITPTSLNDLPSSFTIMAGDFPKNSNEVMITDYQYNVLKEYGYQLRKYNDSHSQETIESIEPDDITPEILLGKKFYINKDEFDSDLVNPYICGIIDTHSNLNAAEEYFKLQNSYVGLNIVSSDFLTYYKVEKNNHSNYILPKPDKYSDTYKIVSYCYKKSVYFIENPSINGISIAYHYSIDLGNSYLTISIILLVLTIASFIWLIYSIYKKQVNDSLCFKYLGIRRCEMTKIIALIIGLISILGLAVSTVIVYSLNASVIPTFYVYGFITYNLSVRQFFMILIVGFIAAILSLIKPIYDDIKSNS